MKEKWLSEIISEIKTGDLLAFRVNRYKSASSFFLFLYQKLMRVPYSHVGVVIKINGHVFLVEATPPRVQITPIEKLGEFYWVPVDISASEERQIKFLKERIDVPYGLKDIITHYLNIDNDETSVYCSELASLFYYNMAYLRERESGHTPSKLVKAVLERAGIEEPIKINIDRGKL